MKMNLSIPPGFHSEEPNAPKFVQTSLFKGTQENLAVIQMLHNMTAHFPSTVTRWQTWTPWKQIRLTYYFKMAK